MSNPKEPDWSKSDDWSEFEWEQAFKFSETMTQQYFGLLSRFGDFPDAEQFIADELGDKSFLYRDDDLSPEFDSNVFERNEDSPREVGPGDPLYYECNPVFEKARLMSLGWCNILSSVLRQEDRFWGLRVLFYMGRILSYLAMGIGDGTFERIDGSIAFTKRVLQQINIVLGEIKEKERTQPSYREIFRIMRENHILVAHDFAVDLLMELRERKRKGGFDD